MSSEYYDSELTAEQIEQALNAIHGVIAPANNGKVLAVENGVIVAKSVSEWGQGGYPEPTGTIQISSNGMVNVKDYESAEVNVPSGITAADEGKVVKNGALVAQTARATEITANGTYDTTENNSVTVNVSGGGSPVIPNAIILTPYSEDNNTGYIGGTEWNAYKSGSEDCRTDMYELDPEDGSTRWFLIFVASGGGNRFRICVFNQDPTLLPSGVPTTLLGSYPSYHSPTYSASENDRGAFTGGLYQVTNITTKKYLCVGKTNANIDGIKSYVIDITGTP